MNEYIGKHIGAKYYMKLNSLAIFSCNNINKFLVEAAYAITIAKISVHGLQGFSYLCSTNIKVREPKENRTQFHQV